MSKAPLTSKNQNLLLQKKYFAKLGKTYNCLGFSTTLGKISCENCFLEGC
jgi:hypothetical protein